ncbi:phosphate acyltransferase PlsX [Rhodohalobacter barkolensis]|uniref:Phosphate acyltransferase n=1 Tax=Rhodohalobacter barkolensis TaxID=2053187 RepID=A0A2N0VKN6_9BACT|nr:phosphate acyltransferase PlsX [Rhodohalobacter barkolensis]PKD44721.1 phosphate acyltransferase PlsX [Rhodohalobacter barkolensis]
MLIAVDAVGGDHYPKNPVLGAIEALKVDDSIEILLLGPEDLIQTELLGLEYDQNRLHIQHAPEIIGMQDSPSAAVKSKRSSSIAIGISAHKNGDCDAFVSAGNTGALLAASTLILGKLEGVIRPTISATYPTLKGISLLIDAGANLDLKPEMYLQFAKMGSIFSTEILNKSNPTIGLLNIGEEPEKGTDCHKEVYKLLSELDEFKGNIEGKDILYGATDIYLTDGFTGNVVLKFGESIPGVLKLLLSKTMEEEKVAPEVQKQLYTILTKGLNTFNYEHVGGVPFLGVNGTSLVGHGGSSPMAIKNMILNAAQCVTHKLNDKIVASLN